MNLLRGNNFHYPISKNPSYEKNRQEITNKYGSITSVVLIALLIFIPTYQFITTKIHRKWGKFIIFKRLLATLNHLIEKTRDQNSVISLMARYGTKVTKYILFQTFLHGKFLFELGFWIALFAYLSLSEINNGDLIFLAKRVGRLAAVSLPTILFLSLRPSPLPDILYLSLLSLHRLLSRIVVLLSILHTGLYCGFFNKKDTWWKVIKKENIYGWVALCGFIIIFLTSLSFFKHRYYRIFYFFHYAWTWIIVVCIQLHARPVSLITYFVINCLILIFQIVNRLKKSRVTLHKSDVRVFQISPNLNLIEIPNNAISEKAKNPGAHLRIARYHNLWIKRWYNQMIPNYHPYTLASLPSDNSQKLIIRRSKFKFLNNQKWIICGSYDPKLLMMSSTNDSQGFTISKIKVNAKRMLIVVGGSAISFALPILRVMNYHGIPVKIIWVIKDFRDILVLKHFDGFIHGDDFEIFVTGEKSAIESKNNSATFVHENGEEQVDENSYLLPPKFDASIDEQAESEPEGEAENVDIDFDEESSLEEGVECGVFQDNALLDNPVNFENIAVPPDQNVDDIDIDNVSQNDNQKSDSIFSLNGRYHSNVHKAHKTDQYSRKTSTSTLNEPFLPYLMDNNMDGSYCEENLRNFNSIVNSLNLHYKIYRGRPIIGKRYYDWCISAGFTQCSGPIEDSSNNYICCRDVVRTDVSQIEEHDVWVVSAGPAALINKVRLWSNENGFNFHEESFYI